MNYNKLHTEVLFSLEKVEGRADVKRMHRRNVNSKFQKMVESYLKLRIIIRHIIVREPYTYALMMMHL